jgi:hypothetical protein
MNRATHNMNDLSRLHTHISALRARARAGSPLSTCKRVSSRCCGLPHSFACSSRGDPGGRASSLTLLPVLRGCAPLSPLAPPFDEKARRGVAIEGLNRATRERVRSARLALHAWGAALPSMVNPMKKPDPNRAGLPDIRNPPGYFQGLAPATYIRGHSG